MDIVIEIDELVLHGFPPGDRYRIGEAVEAELARIFSEHGLPEAWADGEASRLNGGSFHATDGRAAAIGAGVAAAVHRAIVTHDQGATG